MSQRYDRPPTLGCREGGDLSLVPHELSQPVDGPVETTAGGWREPDPVPAKLLATASTSAGQVAGQVASVGRRDFYGQGTGHATRRGWLAVAVRDSYSWRAILLMLSFLAFGLIVSSFVLSL